jgi:hypothetical protein
LFHANTGRENTSIKGEKKMMMRKLFASMVFLLMMSGACAAEELEFDLSAGENSVTGGVHDKIYLDSGYLRIGGSGLYNDDDDTEYKWGALDLTVGSDTLSPGLTCDVGLRAIGGSAKEQHHSSDVGVVGFTLGVGYLFPRDIVMIPLEIFSNVTWAPDPLAFIDTESFLEFNLGAGIRIIKNASIIVTYSNYHVEMTSGPGDWTLNDDVFRLGVILRF